MQSLKKQFNQLISYVLILSLSACTAGTTVNLKADNLQKPVSMTKYIHNSKLEVISTTSYKKVGELNLEFNRKGHFWNLYNPQKDTDLSDEINAKMLELHADGIVNLTIESAGALSSITNTGLQIAGGWLGLAMMFSGTLVPTLIGISIFGGSQYLPGKVAIKIQGDLVKFN